MSNLESAIRDIDLAIEGMYNEDCLKKLQYRLHAVMVHEGGIESGHYWAYVFDHKKKSWLKFNDNTVTEATWEELLKESVGGHSNTSAYSLVYIDTSKPDTLAESDRVMGKFSASFEQSPPMFCLTVSLDLFVLEGDSSMEKMESGAIESLINILPNDLASFVTEDNLLFEKERRKWDIDQENRKKQEAILRECAAGTNTDPNSDVEVRNKQIPAKSSQSTSQFHFTLFRSFRKSSRTSTLTPSCQCGPLVTSSRLTLRRYEKGPSACTRHSKPSQRRPCIIISVFYNPPILLSFPKVAWNRSSCTCLRMEPPRSCRRWPFLSSSRYPV